MPSDCKVPRSSTTARRMLSNVLIPTYMVDGTTVSKRLVDSVCLNFADSDAVLLWDGATEGVPLICLPQG